MSHDGETTACPKCGSSMQGDACLGCGYKVGVNAEISADDVPRDSSIMPTHDGAEFGRPPWKIEPRQYRVFIHAKCRQETRVSGKTLRTLANPYAPLLGATCRRCGLTPLENVSWQDTGETLAAYRLRIKCNELKSLWLPAKLAVLLGAVSGLVGVITVLSEDIPAEATVFVVCFFAGIGVSVGFTIGGILRSAVFHRSVGVDPTHIT